MFNFSNFFLEKNRFFGQENYLYFWKLDSFSNTLHRLKKWNFATVRAAFAPRTPCGGRVIALKWPGRPPRKNPGDATASIWNIDSREIYDILFAHCFECNMIHFHFEQVIRFVTRSRSIWNIPTIRYSHFLRNHILISGWLIGIKSEVKWIFGTITGHANPVIYTGCQGW